MSGNTLGVSFYYNNLSLNDFLRVNFDTYNFTDDTTPYVCYITFKENLKEQFNIAMTWFENNYMKIVSDKCKVSISIIKLNKCGLS